MQKRQKKNMLCISLRTPIKEEYYHLRSTHTQQGNIRGEEKQNEDNCAIRLQNTHAHAFAEKEKIQICLEIEEKKTKNF